MAEHTKTDVLVLDEVVVRAENFYGVRQIADVCFWLADYVWPNGNSSVYQSDQ